MFMDGHPYPASRPRVVHGKGAFYVGNYAKWYRDAKRRFPTFKESISSPFFADVVFKMVKAKTSKRSYPRGDIDNLLKGPFDVISKSGFWEDDDQVVAVNARKEYVDNPEEAGIHIELVELTTEDE
tara:strand:- start:17208 stop:17585 length:378 start_codon:yes stop_codon:yes gene_type:complete